MKKALLGLLLLVGFAKAQPANWLPGLLPPCTTTYQINCTPQVNGTGTYVPRTGSVTNVGGSLPIGYMLQGNGGSDIATSVVFLDSGNVLNSPNGFKSGGSGTGFNAFSGVTSGTVTETVQDAAGTWTFKLPNSAGSAGQNMITDGTGVASWSSSIANYTFGTGYLSTTKVVGTGGVTANLLCKIDSTTPANTVVLPGTGDIGVLGVCISTQNAAANVEVATQGVATCVADNSTTIGHLIGVGTTTAGRCKDLGTTSTALVDLSLQVVGRALTAVSAAANVSVQLFGPGQYGAQVTSADLPNPGASSLGGVRSIDCTGTGHILAISTSGVPSCTADAGGAFDPTDTTVDYKREHFTSGDIASGRIGTSGMVYVTIGGTNTFAYQAGLQNHPGIFRVTTATGADNGLTLGWGNMSSQTSGIDASTWVNYDWDFYAVAALGTNSTGLTYNGFSAGIGNSASTAATGSLSWQVRYNTTAGDSNFMFVVCNATGATGCDDPTPGVAAGANVIDSTVTPVANTYYQFHIYRRKSGVGGNTTVYMQINGGTALTFCSSGCTTTLAHEPITGGSVPHITYWTHTTAARSIDIDYIAYKISGLQLY